VTFSIEEQTLGKSSVDEACPPVNFPAWNDISRFDLAGFIGPVILTGPEPAYRRRNRSTRTEITNRRSSPAVFVFLTAAEPAHKT
jgi:hypothetical protein